MDYTHLIEIEDKLETRKFDLPDDEYKSLLDERDALLMQLDIDEEVIAKAVRIALESADVYDGYNVIIDAMYNATGLPVNLASEWLGLRYEVDDDFITTHVNNKRKLKLIRAITRVRNRLDRFDVVTAGCLAVWYGVSVPYMRGVLYRMVKDGYVKKLRLNYVDEVFALKK